MEVIIWFEKQKLVTKIPSSISVKDVLLNIRMALNKQDGHFMLLSNKFEHLPETSMINADANKAEFYLLFQQEIAKAPSPVKEEKIEDLIMKVTGANSKLACKKQEQKMNYRNNLFSILNSMSGLGEEDGLNPSQRRIMDLLNVFEESGLNFGDLRDDSGNNERIEPNESSVQELKEMGFPEDKIRAALVRARNDLSRATDILLSGDDE